MPLWTEFWTDLRTAPLSHTQSSPPLSLCLLWTWQSIFSVSGLKAHESSSEPGDSPPQLHLMRHFLFVLLSTDWAWDWPRNSFNRPTMEHYLRPDTHFVHIHQTVSYNWNWLTVLVCLYSRFCFSKFQFTQLICSPYSIYMLTWGWLVVYQCLMIMHFCIQERFTWIVVIHVLNAFYMEIFWKLIKHSQNM